MRPDLAKLTTEKERRGSSGYSKKYGGKVRIVHDDEHDYEEEFGGFRSSSRRRAYGWNCKEFSDVLAPLRGALRKNVGRPWDKVYSEFCEVLDRRSLSGIHIFSHLVGFKNGRGGEVTVNGLFIGEDGKVYEYPYGGHFFGKTAKASEADDFYVHPKTGILCYSERQRHRYPDGELVRLRDNDVRIGDKNYKMINGLWFEVWYEKRREVLWSKCWIQDHPEEWYKSRGYFKNKNGEWGYHHSGNEYDKVYRQRSLNSKEIKMVKKYQARRIKELE